MTTLPRTFGWSRAAALLVGSAVCTAAIGSPSVFPTGVTRYDPRAAYNCDVLFSADDPKTGDPRTYLIDMDGHILHTWSHAGFPAKMIDPALAQGRKGLVGLQLSAIPAGGTLPSVGAVPGATANFRNRTFGIIDWSDRIVWQWGQQAPEGAALQHHDWDALPDGNVLMLSNLIGPLPGFGKRPMEDDVLYEIDRAGHIVWRWAASEHLQEFGFTAAQISLLEHVSAPDYLHFNDAEPLGPNHWARAGDTRFAPENILVSSRNANFIAIISRRTGHIVWREGPNFTASKQPYGPDTTGRPVPYPLDRFSGQRDAHMIPDGLPGAGDILLFDNEGEGGYPPATMPMIAGSRVLEIDPVRSEVVWKYMGTKASFFSPFISSVQRLPNGNTLVDEGIDGRFFQVTPAGQIVWEYVSPFESSLWSLPTATARNRVIPAAAVYRIQAIPYEWLPAGTPHGESAVRPPPDAQFHLPASP